MELQCYNNAAVMAGYRNGINQRITKKNNLATIVNCNNHSLNLVGVHAAKQATMMITFLGIIKVFYMFFSHSAEHWEKLKNIVPVVVIEARWSAMTKAVKINKFFRT